jgi:putative transposase
MISQSELPVSHACETLSITRPTYYRWKAQDPKDPNRELKAVMHQISLESSCYGYRRMTKELRRRNHVVNHKKVRRLMKEEKLACKTKRKYKPITTQSNHGLPIYPNLVKGLEVTRLNQVWVSDITYIRLLSGFVYLAVIIDLCSRKCVVWALSRNVDTQLTLDALQMAIRERKHLGLMGLIHHSDQGVQYASQAYVDQLGKEGMLISMSRKANVYDNAWAESFMKTLKVEEVYMNEYETFEDVYVNIKQFIEEVYNKKRLHSGIGYLPPDEYEAEVLNTSVEA